MKKLLQNIIVIATIISVNQAFAKQITGVTVESFETE